MIKRYIFILVIGAITLNCSCQNNDQVEDLGPVEKEEENLDKDYLLPNIDLNHWKVTLPIGKPTEIYPPEILDYATNETLKPFFYNDSTKGALVFYTYPGATTANTSYSRTELRELIDPSDLTVNWKFKDGARMVGELSVPEISKDENGDYNRTIIMQIHGRLSNEQKDLIGAKDNNAPPILKIYWVNGKVRVKTKVLKDLNATYEEMLSVDAWGDDDGYTFKEYVGKDKFKLEVVVSEGRMEVILNDRENRVYDDINIDKWGVFENYFKAGNYLVSKDENSYAYVNYFSLNVSH